MSLVEIIGQIEKEISVDANGHGKATMRAVARLVGVEPSTILRLFEGVDQKPSEIAKTLIEQGFSCVALKSWRTEGIPDIAIAVIAEYYAYEAGRYCKQQAKLVCRAFRAIGIFQNLGSIPSI